ncbi:unnamed protein product [Linum tenue]|uniref:Uncharacterized protein n=1 Tax=Linum tenue TaxID=586396 RepID=A0AAV0ISA5_9ROSI|nr:unnamed protein product [Linum tenue]
METGASNCRETSRTSDGGEGNRRLEKTKPSSLLRPSSLHLPSGVVDYSLIKATEFIAKGWNALKEEEVDRVIDYCELNDHRPIPHLRNDLVQSDQQALFYLEKAVDQGHAGAAIAYGSLLLRGRQQLSKQNPVDKIINLKACMNFLEEPKISNEAKDLIGHLLCDVHTRLGTRGVEELKDMQYTRECCDSLLSAAAMTLHVPTGAQSKAEVRRWQRRATGTVSDAKPGVGAHFSETTGLCVKLPTESFSS